MFDLERERETEKGTWKNKFLIYCIFCLQVRKAIKQKFERWQDNRSIATRYTRASIVTNTETIGLNVKRNSTTDNGRISSASNLTRSSRDYTNGSSGLSGKDDNLNQVTMPMLKDEPLWDHLVQTHNYKKNKHLGVFDPGESHYTCACHIEEKNGKKWMDVIIDVRLVLLSGFFILSNAFHFITPARCLRNAHIYPSKDLASNSASDLKQRQQACNFIHRHGMFLKLEVMYMT